MSKSELTFLDKKNPLYQLQKKLKESLPKAIDVLNAVVNSEDGYSVKEKMEASKFIIENYTKITEAITKDQFARLVAEVKLKGLNAKPQLREINGDEINGVSETKAHFTLSVLDPDKLDGVVQETDTFDASDWDVQKTKI